MWRNVKLLSAIDEWLTAVCISAVFILVTLPALGQDQRTSPDPPASQTASQQGTSAKKSPSSSTQTGPRGNQKSFSSPEKAADALYDAARNHRDDDILLILGPDAKDVVMWTDDAAARKDENDRFVTKYAQMHRLVREPDNETTLYIGPENWPLPIPLVQKNGAWYFDAGLGRHEIMYRRIGENEFETVDVLHAMVDAQNEYYSQSAGEGGAAEYARRFVSDEGKHDGLYWPGAKDPNESPIGPYLAQASYERPDRKPMDGYYFRILSEQGSHALGGARSYIVNGKMTGGFAFVAFPAEYRSSGVMTFIVDQNDIIYQKDLGPATAQIAKSMTAYNPDSTWSKVH